MYTLFFERNEKTWLFGRENNSETWPLAAEFNVRYPLSHICQTNVTKPGNNDSLKSVELLVVHWWDPTFGMVGRLWVVNWTCLDISWFRKSIESLYRISLKTYGIQLLDVIGINEIFRMTYGYSPKLDVMNHIIHLQLVKGYHPLPPGAPAREGYQRILVWFWFSSLCGAVLRTLPYPSWVAAGLPKVRLCHSLKHILAGG